MKCSGRHIGLPLLLLFFSGCVSSGPAQAPQRKILSASLPPSLYQRVPAGKSPRSLPQFFVVDDFSTRELRNRLGSSWKMESAWEAKEDLPRHPSRKVTRYLTKPVPMVGTVIRTPFKVAKGIVVGKGGSVPMGTFRLRRSREDSLQKRGGSLSFSGSLAPQVKIIFKSALKNLDVSQAQSLVLHCRTHVKGGAFGGKQELSLRDQSGKTESYDMTSACLTDASHPWRELVLPRSLFSTLDWNQLQEIRFTLHSGSVPLNVQMGIDEIAFYGKGEVAFESERDNLVGFPLEVDDSKRKASLLAETANDKLLYEIARDTWKYFENALDRKTQLPVDHIRVRAPGGVGSYTTPTNLAMYFFACVAARELGLISKKEAVRRIHKTLKTLGLMKRWNGFHYNFYHTHTLEVTRAYVSTVDSGWLAAAWVVLRQAFPKELGEPVSRFLKEADFSEFYDPSVGQLRLGFDEALGNFSPYHYGLIATEARVASLVGIGKGDLPPEHWWRIYRTPPKDWTWQSQVPEGKETKIDGVSVFEGYYSYQGRKFVPSWGGSLFEFLMPTLVLKEKESAPKSLGLNNRVATEIQIDYALNRQGYPIWGISPASTSSGRLWRYGEYGVKYLGVKGYRDEGIIAPYAAFLALDTFPDHAIDNLRRMLELYEVYGEYGFYDSINIRNGRVNAQYLALDQGMTLVAIANYLRKGVIKKYFHQDEIGRKAETLLGKEEWFQ